MSSMLASFFRRRDDKTSRPEMGNEQSGVRDCPRKSVDENALRQVKSAQSTPRISLTGPKLLHKHSEQSLSVAALRQHRLSVGECTTPLERRGSRTRLSAAGEHMGNTQQRRASRSILNGGDLGLEAGMSLQEHLKLSAYQCQLLQTTWTKMRASSATFTQIFKLLCFKSTLAREIFQKLSIVEGFKADGKCDLNAHAKMLSDMMDSILTEISQPSKCVQSRCSDVGSSHHNMNESSAAAVWECLGECMAEVITKVDCVRTKREAGKAWITVISFLVDSMKNGYMDEYRRNHISRSSVHK